MSKAHRGKGLREIVAAGRSTCPVCGRTAVKVVYEQEIDGKKTKICKICKAHLANAK
jgi:RNA polymerase subunit RPABC4/transcription elongation factor Spt4